MPLPVRRLVGASLDHGTAAPRRWLLRRDYGRRDGIKVNVGSGSVPLPGWVNTDLDFRVRYFLDATRPWPFQAGAVSHVYGDNMIEHVTLDGAREMFRHAYAVMIPGGRIRLATPDVEGIARLYLNDNGRGSDHLDRHRRRGYRVEHRVDLLNLLYMSHGHWAGYLYDFAALAGELEAAGFVDVERFEPGESNDSELRGLESRLDETDAAASLIVEAVRPH